MTDETADLKASEPIVQDDDEEQRRAEEGCRRRREMIWHEDVARDILREISDNNNDDAAWRLIDIAIDDDNYDFLDYLRFKGAVLVVEHIRANPEDSEEID